MSRPAEKPRTVAIVDDDDLVRETVRLSLEHAGFTASVIEDPTVAHAREEGAEDGSERAGVGELDDLHSGNAAYHADIFAVNVISLLNTILPFMPQMIRQKSGQLVAIASVAGFRALPGSTTYAATKVAVRALMEGYGWELRRHGIATTTINPGFVVSEMTAPNQFHMPFLVPTDIAAGKIARAIRRRRRSYTFPWPMACLAHLDRKSVV